MHIDELWQVLLFQSLLNNNYFTVDQISFIVCIAILLTADKSSINHYMQNKWLYKFIDHTLSLHLDINLSRILNAIFSTVLHHHTRTYICSSLPITSERGRARVFQIIFACQIICENSEDIVVEIGKTFGLICLLNQTVCLFLLYVTKIFVLY